MTYLEDIFEAEDALSPDADPKDLPEDFFSHHTTDCAHPLLNPKVVQKLMKYITKCARPVGRSGREEVAARAKGRMADVETATLARLLKILERSVRIGHDIDPFETASAQPSDSIHGSPRKKGKDGHFRGETPKSSDDQAVGPSDAVSDLGDQSGVDVSALERSFDAARDSILAANCCILLLSSDRLPKQVRKFNSSRIYANIFCSFTRRSSSMRASPR